MPRHFVDLLELTTAEAERLIGQSLQLKRNEKQDGTGRRSCPGGPSG